MQPVPSAARDGGRGRGGGSGMARPGFGLGLIGLNKQKIKEGTARHDTFLATKQNPHVESKRVNSVPPAGFSDGRNLIRSYRIYCFLYLQTKQ